MPSQAALEKARDLIAETLAEKDHLHSVGIGLRNGKPVVKVLVVAKLPEAQVSARGLKLVPRVVAVDVDGQHEDVETDVEECAPFTPELLRLPEITTMSDGAVRYLEPMAISDHQRCHNYPIPGGVQMQPLGAPWVGTLGCFLEGPDGQNWALTNYHVAVGGRFGEGHHMSQPAGSNAFGILIRWPQIKFDGSPNTMDAAILEVDRIHNGKTVSGVAPSSFDIGRLNPEPTNPHLGQRVVKSGRTTGVTAGVTSQIGTTTFVNYGPEGTAKFVGCVVLDGDHGDLSAPGDSGSLILEQGTLKPHSHLFAGGGGKTIAYPIKTVLEWSGGKFV